MDKNYSNRRKDVIETCESVSISPKESIYDYGYDDGKKDQLLKDKELIDRLLKELKKYQCNIDIECAGYTTCEYGFLYNYDSIPIDMHGC